MSFSIGRSRLTVSHEFVRIDYASDAPVISGGGVGRLIGPHHAAAALNDDIFFAAGDLWRQSNFKLYR
jgi:hypothetical protein